MVNTISSSTTRDKKRGKGLALGARTLLIDFLLALSGYARLPAPPGPPPSLASHSFYYPVTADDRYDVQRLLEGERGQVLMEHDVHVWNAFPGQQQPRRGKSQALCHPLLHP